MQKGNLKLIVFLSLANFFFLFSPLVLAQDTGLVPCGPGTSKPSCDLCDLFVLFDNIIDFLLLDIVPPLAIFVLAVAGIMYIGAFFEILPGGFQTVSKAKSIFTAVIIGLFLIYGAWFIVGLFLKAIGLADWTQQIYESWWQEGAFKINCPTQ